MKKFILALVALFAVTVSANAMSYEQARRQALFLTDKMAYELNLTDEQYEAAYEINLDYLLGVDSYDDLYGMYWRQRNLDLSYVLLDWQYRMYVDAAYFYRPLYWDGGYWHFGIYARYPHRDYFYFGCPHFYTVYRGGHSWRMNGGRSWYEGRFYGSRNRDRHDFSGMRNRYDRGDFGRGTVAHNGEFGNGSRPSNRGGESMVRSDGSRAYGGRTTTLSPQRNSRGESFGRADNSAANRNNNAVSPRTMGNASRTQSVQPQQRGGLRPQTDAQRENTGARRGGSGFGSSTRTTVTRPSSTERFYSTPSRSFTPQRSNGNFNQQPSRSYSAPSRSYSAPSRSFSSPSPSYSSPSRSFSAPSRSSAPSMNRSNGGGSRSGSTSFGGRR
ncbi:MAG: hypothetical protein SOY06_00445 [Prevotella sp.]|nr:hypothetical protein [Bacteroidales bacterium]MDY4228309.1 hypothetical protein [Prevotella sp.]